MIPRERVKRALAKQKVDRIPVYMWFHPETTRRLANLLEVPPALVSQAMGNDIRQTWVNNNYAMEGITHEHDGESHVDYWGIGWTKQFGFNQITSYPLAGCSTEKVLEHALPLSRITDLLAPMVPLSRSVGDYYLGCDVSPCAFEMYWRLRGMEDALLDIASDPALAYEMLGRCADFSIELAKVACNRYQLDWLWTGDDIGSQQAMMMNPEAWRRLIKPHLARVFAVGADNGLPVAFHSCGALRPIIPDLIEIGMNVLNPIQGNCPGMDPIELKMEFGSSIAFMGGVDTQDLLPNGTVREVRDETERLVDAMTADGGGYILAASHTIAPETPDANIFAMYEAVSISREEIFDNAASVRTQISKSAVHPDGETTASGANRTVNTTHHDKSPR